MKRRLFALLAILMASIACNVGIPNAVRGSGNIISQTFDVSEFDQVELGTIGEVHIEQGDTESLTIETDDNILPLLVVNVDGGKLTLNAKDNTNIEPSATITFNVTVTEITSLNANSSGEIFVRPINGDSLEILVNASGDVNLENVEVKDFSVTSSGSGNTSVDNIDSESIHAVTSASGNVELTGNAGSLQVESGGSGDVLAGDLQTSVVEIVVEASGDVTVWAVDTLDVSISASGNVEYYGDPAVTENLNGSGNLTALGEK